MAAVSSRHHSVGSNYSGIYNVTASARTSLIVLTHDVTEAQKDRQTDRQTAEQQQQR